MNLKMDFLYRIYSIGQVLWVTEVRKHQNILKKGIIFSVNLIFGRRNECQQSYARTGNLWIDDFFNFKRFFINIISSNNGVRYQNWPKR